MKQSDFVEIMNEINLSEESKQAILRNCAAKKHSSNKLFVYSRQLATACALGIFFLAGLTTYAAVNAYHNYMSKMSREETSQRAREINQGQNNADSFSRTLSESEKARLASLAVEYRQGLRFPERSMERIEGMTGNAELTERSESMSGDTKLTERSENMPGDTESTEYLSYDFVNNIFYIPVRELTDEELLQIVDVWEKANYSLSLHTPPEDVLTEKDQLEKAEQFMEQYKEEVAVTDEDKIRRFAENLIASMGKEGKAADVSDYTFEISLYGERNPKYWVVAENSEEKYSIFFTADSTPDTLHVEKFRHSSKIGESKPYTAEETEKTLHAEAENIASMFRECLGIDVLIVRKELYHGRYLVFTDDCQNRYRICLNPGTGEVVELLTYFAGEYDDVDLSGEVLE